MSEELDAAQEDGAEPSMEDILASIRRILAEEEEEEGSEEVAAAPEPTPEPEPEPVMAAPEPEPVMAAPEPAPPPPPPPPPPMPSEMEEILELTPDMVAAPELVSSPTFQSGADMLSELAKAILDQRDMSVGGSRDITLETMVREMLKPILREWLDRNLPYLIERLVKKEIDKMINRAERLDS
jgi:cell pole-organizing protein PopZ